MTLRRRHRYLRRLALVLAAAALVAPQAQARLVDPGGGAIAVGGAADPVARGGGVVGFLHPNLVADGAKPVYVAPGAGYATPVAAPATGGGFDWRSVWIASSAALGAALLALGALAGGRRRGRLAGA